MGVKDNKKPASTVSVPRQKREKNPKSPPGGLWSKVQKQTQHALDCGALITIPTRLEFIEHANVRFMIRIIDKLTHKKNHHPIAKNRDKIDPFLPYEQDLLVSKISDTHICILNKFNVIDNHVLIITQDFEHQETLLNLKDFEAMWACMAEYDGLVFYNSGPGAGSSQSHKHLQMVPLPLAPESTRIPIEPLIQTDAPHNGLGQVSRFPFRHVIAPTDPSWLDSPLQGAKAALEHYCMMLKTVDMPTPADSKTKLTIPYNFLVTRRWMLLVPRSIECFNSVSINALGFAGSLLAKNNQQLQNLQRHGPMNVLQQVAVPVEQ